MNENIVLVGTGNSGKIDTNDYSPCKAIIRPDLEGLNIPHAHGYIENDGTVFECWQPEELNEQEFNLVLKNPKTEEMFLAISIDFDFPE